MVVRLDDDATRKLTAPGETFEMVEEDVLGQRMRVWKNAPPNLRTILEGSKAHGEKDFLVYEDEGRYTFASHYRAAAGLAHRLVEDFGIRKGDRVAIAMRNYPEWVISFWAAASVGAIVVPLNAWWTGPELAYGLEDSGARVLFCDGERAEALKGHLAGLPVERVIVAKAGETPPVGDPFDEALWATDGDVELPEVDIDPDDDATIFYTSGTTGKPKGAVGTHRNICTNLMNLAFAGYRSAVLRGEEPGQTPEQQPTSLLTVPLFHATGCHSTLVPATAFGSKLVLVYRFDPERALELIERERVTSFGGVPTMVWRVLESPDIDKRDVSSVQRIGYGGAPAAPELVKRIREVFGDVVSPGNGYGLTETSSLAIGNGGEEYQRKPDSVGRPAPVVDAKIVGPDGTELGPGEIGELWMRGPNVVRGYWNRPEATAEAITDGWLHSGDLAKVDEEGFITIVDRAKDMVIRGGENVYCAEVEAALYEHPAVLDAAVFGIPHRTLGEEVAAAVQRKPGAEVTAEELQGFLAERIAKFKIPVRIDVRDTELPRNAAGKILKRHLKEEFAAAG